MPITGAGRYQGYTQGGGDGQLPTLYFEKGRYTQEHRKEENVGWHPIIKGDQYRVNIDPAIHRNYGILRRQRSAARDVGNNDEVRRISGEMNVIHNGVVTKALAEFDDGKLMEVNHHEGKFSGHPSRGKFIRKEAAEFQAQYGNEYAQDVLARGVVAPNSLGHTQELSARILAPILPLRGGMNDYYDAEDTPTEPFARIHDKINQVCNQAEQGIINHNIDFVIESLNEAANYIQEQIRKDSEGEIPLLEEYEAQASNEVLAALRESIDRTMQYLPPKVPELPVLGVVAAEEIEEEIQEDLPREYIDRVVSAELILGPLQQNIQNLNLLLENAVSPKFLEASQAIKKANFEARLGISDGNPIEAKDSLSKALEEIGGIDAECSASEVALLQEARIALDRASKDIEEEQRAAAIDHHMAAALGEALEAGVNLDDISLEDASLVEQDFQLPDAANVELSNSRA